MTRARQTKRLLRQLGSAPALVEDPGRAAARREAVVGRLSELLEAEAGQDVRRSQRSRRLTVLAAAAAVALVVGGWALLRPGGGPELARPQPALPQVIALSGSVNVARAGQATQPAGAEPVRLGLTDEVRTGAAGEAQVTLASGATVRVGADSRLQLARASEAAGRPAERLELLGGRIDLVVPKLGPDGSLAVATPHAQVVVRGTRFSVQVVAGQDDSGLVTQVGVTEGAVVVRAGGRETSLGPGAHWSSAAERLGRLDEGPREGGAASPSAAVPDGADAPPPPAASAIAARPSGSAAADPPDVPGSTLAEENRLYSKALAARRGGDDVAVVAHLDQLIRSYPSSTLLPEARLERSRALKRLGRGGGKGGGAQR